MSTVNYYRIYCNSESIFVYNWGTEPPTTCCNNHEHTVDTGTISILQTISQNSVYIQNLTGTTGGQYRCESKSFTVAANSVGYEDYTWPFDISVKSVFFHTSEDQAGDLVKSLIAPHATIGVLTASASSNDTAITVSPTVLVYAQRGYLLTLVNNTNGFTEEIGQYVSFSGNTITVSQAIVAAFPAGSYVQMTVNNIDLIIGPPGCMKMEAKGSTSSLLPAGTIVRAQYSNNGATEKTFTFHTEYFY
jgi:hypothetical protein